MNSLSKLFRLAALLLVVGALLGLRLTTTTLSAQVPENIFEADKLVIAIDNSGSIRDAELLAPFKQAVKSSLQNLLNSGGEGKRIAVVSFETEIVVSLWLTPLINSYLPDIFYAIDSIPATDGWKYTAGAIYAACDILWSEPGNGALILLTDGLPTTDGSSHGNEQAAIEATREAAQFFKENCSILAIVGVALERDAEEFLREIASRDLLWSVPPDPKEIERALTEALTGEKPCPPGLRVPEDYSSIEAAIDAAEPGDAIIVDPGTYTEELWIDKDIFLCGAGADVTTIEGNIMIATGAPRIEGFRITGSSSSGIIVNHYTQPAIWHNIIEHHDYDGITIWSLSEPEISYNVIRYNDGCGVSIDVPERTTVTGTGNEIYDNGQDLCPSEEDFPPGFRK